jgi:hypothetical protein
MRWKTLILCVQDWPTPQFGGANEETQLFPPWTLFTSLCSISWLFLYTFKSLFTTCGLLWHLIPPLVTTSNFCQTKNNKVIFRDLVKHKLSCCWRPFFKGTTPYTSMSTLNFQGLISPSTIPIIFFYLDLSCSFLPLDEKSFLKSWASQFEFPSCCDFWLLRTMQNPCVPLAWPFL